MRLISFESESLFPGRASEFYTIIAIKPNKLSSFGDAKVHVKVHVLIRS